jgi:repressor LexA
MKLTARQAEVYDFVKRSVDERGFPPTVAEIAAHFGMRSPNAAAQHLRLIRQKGAIEITPGVARGIRLVGGADGKQQLLGKQGGGRKTNTTIRAGERAAGGESLPIVGRVAAGSPILAEENIDGSVRIDPRAFAARADYLLRVSGDSMVNCGIHDGDLVAVRRTPEVRNNSIAVVRVGGGAGEVTVKRFQRSGAIVKLIPESSRHKTLRVDLRDEPVTIEGEVVGLLRTSL